jgi:hypothetical protein
MIHPKKNEKQTPRVETKEEAKASFRLRTGIKAGAKTASDDWQAPVV